MIGWLDPSISSRNVGDHIIREAVLDVLTRAGTSPDSLVSLPTQRTMTKAELSAAKECRYFVVGGTNLLSSNMPWYRQWKVGMREFPVLRGKVILLGVGWWQYQNRPNAFTRWLLRELLHPNALHSVRDRWTASQLSPLGLRTAYTACPTMWALPEVPEARKTRGKRLILTLTDYNRSPDHDRALVSLAEQLYGELAFWPQGSKDEKYERSLASEVQVLPAGVQALDSALADESTDFLGTRLHGGIRALQHGRRASIIAIDNRASEIARDTRLPVVSRAGVWSKTLSTARRRRSQAWLTRRLKITRAAMSPTRRGRRRVGWPDQQPRAAAEIPAAAAAAPASAPGAGLAPGAPSAYAGGDGILP